MSSTKSKHHRLSVATGRVGCIQMLALAALLAATSGCGGGGGNNPEASRSANAAPQVEQTTTAPRVTHIRFSSVGAAGTKPLDGHPLTHDEALQVELGLSGDSRASRVEVRISDGKGNGIYRDSRTVGLENQSTFSYRVPSPEGGWKSGNYLFVPVVDDAELEAGGFTVQ